MSISYLTSPNDYQLYSKKLTSSEVVSDILETVTQTVDTLSAVTANISGNASVLGSGTIGTLVSDRLQTITGSNYFATWDATKTYKLGDLVIYQGLFYRVIQNNVLNQTPQPSNPADPYYVSLSSNNAIKNDLLYLQVSTTNGNDSKALTSPTPFATIQAALNFAQNGSRIVLVDQASTWNETITVTGKNNITIEGNLNGIYESVGNTISKATNGGTNITFTNCQDITIKNVVLSVGANISGVLAQFTSCKNITFDNVVFDTVDGSSNYDIYITYPGTGIQMGDCVFINCRSKTASATQYLNIRVTCDTGSPTLSRMFLLNHLGPIGFNNMSFSTAGGDVTSYDNYFMYATNCNNYIGAGPAHHVGNYTFRNCTFGDILTSTSSTGSTNNKLNVIDSTILNVNTNTYYAINKTGACPYLFQNFDYDKNNVTSLTGTSLANYSTGPAKYFNQLAALNTVVGTTSLTSGTQVQLPLGTVANDTWDIIDIINPNELTIKGSGVFLLSLNAEFSTNQTVGNCGTCNIWVGPVAGAEPGVSQTSCLLPYVSSTATYPTVRNNNIIMTVNQAATTVYSIYFRNLGTTTFTVRMIGLMIWQLR